MIEVTQSNFFQMNNTIKNYAWGSIDSMQDLFTISNPEKIPQAEMWMGDHPNGCSKITNESQEILLSDFIASAPSAILGRHQHSKNMPYLFKVLAVEKALSVQVHPNKQQAKIGFLNENKLGILQGAYNRTYHDANHKPELVFALTPYKVMNGFRDLTSIVHDFEALKITSLACALAHFKTTLTDSALASFFTILFMLSEAEKKAAITILLNYAQQQDTDRHQLITKLAQQYPGDLGIFSPLFLHTVILQPGEAMFLRSGTPHAYVYGTALEIMANSDNVLRAGLTEKHIDIQELVTNMVFTPLKYDELRLKLKKAKNITHYPVPIADFSFSIYTQPQAHTLTVNSAEILFAMDAPVSIFHASGEILTFNKGESIFIPAYAKEYKITTLGRLARAYTV